MNIEELTSFLDGLGQPAFRAGQLFRWLHGRAACSFAEMTDLPRDLREELTAKADTGCLEVVVRRDDSADGTVKFLLRLADGETIETVALHYRFGVTVCVSSQVGCAMGCLFCASTVGGRVRDLTAGEMLDQVLTVQRNPGGSPARRVSRVVIMGIGEPLENYEAVLRFIRLGHEPDGLGIGYRRFTLSTCGLVPEVRRLTGEGIPVNLAISLHAPNDELRERLMPVNRRYPLRELIAACDHYVHETKRRVTYEYALIDEVNDGVEHARELGRLLQGRLCHVNLIPLNPGGRGLKGSPAGRVTAFRDILDRYGVPVTVRRGLGTEIEAACGQLRRLRRENEAMRR